MISAVVDVWLSYTYSTTCRYRVVLWISMLSGHSWLSEHGFAYSEILRMWPEGLRSRWISIPIRPRAIYLRYLGCSCTNVMALIEWHVGSVRDDVRDMLLLCLAGCSCGPSRHVPGSYITAMQHSPLREVMHTPLQDGVCSTW